ncbi:hypothetical protein PPYR_05905 [Photinus pyralis]|uniref:Protein kinase domain-containing protein n=2 Tax=Photinus pyralis TaxID=7054 RepID=A0A5N4AW40_PHOPY|nr:dual specificity tyrosine-phosphorylation-regulated kinase 1B-like [Photinus pyralis]KAB0801551.1 hypothetical protein PPYR_05905 [Photinus pyralis]
MFQHKLKLYEEKDAVETRSGSFWLNFRKREQNRQKTVERFTRDMDGVVLAHRFKIIGLLGRGTFGSVYRAVDIYTSKRLALKVSNDKYYNFSLTKEGELIRALNVVGGARMVTNIVGSTMWRGFKCVLYRECVGTLLSPITMHPNIGVSLNLIRIYTRQLLQALCFLNSKRLIHCDIKPENVLVCRVGSAAIKLGDFGASQSFHQPELCFNYVQNRCYRAPEVFLGMPITRAIDMWSIGCIMVELFAGCMLFDGSDSIETFHYLMELFGFPPADMIEFGSNSPFYFISSGNRYFLKPIEGRDFNAPGSKELLEILGLYSDKIWTMKTGGLNVTECYEFFNLVSKILVYRPNARLRPENALHHVFLNKKIRPRVKNLKRKRYSKECPF